MATQFPSAFVLPTIADTNPGYVNDVIAVALAATPDGDIGPLATVMSLQGVGYLTGALLFGIALYRARVLVRWASALLALSGLLTAALSVMPDALYRFLAWPNGIALVALGYSLWRTTRTSTTPSQTTPTPRATTAGGPVTLDTDQTAARGTRAGPGRPGPAGTPSLGEPVALVLLSLIPVTAGVLRIIEILGGPQLFSENPRVDASPAPVALHLAAAATYALGGAFQFSARLRRRHPGWHRTTGRVLHERLDVVVEHSGSRL